MTGPRPQRRAPTSRPSQPPVSVAAPGLFPPTLRARTKGRSSMFSITFQGFTGMRVIYVLTGDVRSIYLTRLEQLIRASRRHGMNVCFDMEQVTSLDAGVLRFFAEGPGREAQVQAPPGKLRTILDGQDKCDGN